LCRNNVETKAGIKNYYQSVAELLLYNNESMVVFEIKEQITNSRHKEIRIAIALSVSMNLCQRWSECQQRCSSVLLEELEHSARYARPIVLTIKSTNRIMLMNQPFLSKGR
jgi:hypothetical protein